MNPSLQDLIEQEERDIKRFKELAKEIAQASIPLWHLCDGIGGYVMECLDKEFSDAGLKTKRPKSDPPKKKKIPNWLRTQVFERDKYRCVYCGSHIDLCADHIHPESLGGATELENLQTLCRPCNSKKCAKTDYTHHG